MKIKRRRTPMHDSSHATVPLALVGAELGTDADQLARRLDGAVSIDPATGIRVISAAHGRRLIDDHRAKAEARLARREKERAEAAANDTSEAVRQHVKALKAAQRDFVDPDASAFAVMMANDPDNRLNRAGRFMDEFLSGTDHYHAINTTKEQ
jgi:hypothetical protein